MSAQQSDFDIPLAEGALDVSRDFREALTAAIRRSNLSRYQIVAQVSEYIGVDITKDMLDKYTSNNLSYGLRAEHLPAILATIKCVEPARILMAPIRHYVISSTDNDLLKLKHLLQRRAELDSEIIDLQRTLG